MVIEIHPEELFDKLSTGSLNPLEDARLRAHLAGCSVCRFELQARVDFQDDRTLQAAPPQSTQSHGAALREAGVSAASQRPRALPRRRRAVIWTLAAAALFIATGALASAVAGKPPWALLGVASPPAEVSPSDAPALRPHRKARNAALPAPSAPCAVEPCAEVPAPAAALAPTALVAAATGITAPEPSARLAKAPGATTSASALFAEANRARTAGDPARAVQLYRNLQRQFPRSREAELSELTLARLFLDSGDARSALAGFETYLARGSRPLGAEAMVGRALSLRLLGRRDAEAAAWHDVLQSHPRSVYARQASERLVALGRL